MPQIAIPVAPPRGILPDGSGLPDVAGARPRRARLDSRSLAALAFALTGCSGLPDGGAATAASSPAAIGGAAQEQQGYANLVGVRASQGNAVNCPEIRTDDGALHPVSGLGSDIAIGDRIVVSGTLGISTRCIGKVLIIKDIKRL
jgi:hypothetical protein